MGILLEKLWRRGREFLGVQYPVMAGAMTWVSNYKLVAAVSNHGGFGCLAGGNMPPELLTQEIDQTRALTDKPFAVNLITIAPNYKEHFALVSDKQVPFIIFAGSIPRGSEIKSAKSSGAKVLAFASNESIAERMLDRGIDALILEGNEAGGHIGHVSLVILLQQVLFQFNQVPIFVAGGIGTGRLIAHLLLMGAAGIQMGTRFILTHECEVHPRFKAAFLKARARDAIASPAVTSELHVVAVRAIRNHSTDEFANLQIQLLEKIRRGEITQAVAQFEVEKFWVGALRRAVQDGDVGHGSLMAGQSVGLVHKIQSLHELFTEIITDAETELQRVQQVLAG